MSSARTVALPEPLNGKVNAPSMPLKMLSPPTMLTRSLGIARSWGGFALVSGRTPGVA